MRKAARRESARSWIASGAAVTVKSCARRYGTDKYTAYDDLTALGFPLPEKDRQWAVRPDPVPRSRKTREPDSLPGIDWFFNGDRVMMVIDTTPGGAPFGPEESVEDHLAGDCLFGPGACPWEEYVGDMMSCLHPDWKTARAQEQETPGRPA